MIRYAATFFRYWFIVLLPILVLPVAEYTQVRHSSFSVYASANIYIQQSPTAGNTPWLTPAQSAVNNIDQLLQSPSFDLAVASKSERYTRLLARNANPGGIVFADLTKNVQVAPKGDNLVNIGYTGNDWLLAEQVVKSIIDAAQTYTAKFNQQESAQNVNYYAGQLHNAKLQAARSARQFSDYLTQHGITITELTTLLGADPTLATLYDQSRSDQANVTSLQQKLNSVSSQPDAPPSVAGASTFFVTDPPTASIVSRKKQEILSIAIALLIGLLLGGGFLVTMTAMDRTVRFIDEAPSLFGLPLLAVAPYDTSLANWSVGSSAPSPATNSANHESGWRRIG